MAKQTWTIGKTPAEVRAININNFNELYSQANLFSVKNYGAVGNGIADDTDAIQDCIDAANISPYGVVYFPAGTYLSNTVNFYEYTPVIGDGYNLTQIKSISAVPLFSMKKDATWSWGWYMRRIKLNGDNVGTIGLDTKYMAFFTIRDCWIQNFTDCGVYLLGGENGTFYDCFFAGCNGK
jgi:hypothetical protein